MQKSKGIRFIRTTILIVLVLFCVKSIQAQLDPVRINEFMALNDTTLTDEDGNYSDWIELYNYSAVDLSLAGWCLTDDPAVPGKWIFPDVTIPANGYVLIFASGKDQHIAGYELHTNFKLESQGEYLALISPAGLPVSAFDPAFPPQQADVSFGFLDGVFLSFGVSTPGSENLSSGAILPAPLLSARHGFFENPFELEITSEVEGADIYYTTNGNTPDTANGKLYTSPLTVETTTVVRAMAVKENHLPGMVATQTYLFPDDVIRQSNQPAGYPAEWGPYTAISGTAIADYEMDPEMMSDPAFASDVIDGLKAIPTMSLVSDIGYFFSHSTDPDTGGIYIYTGPPLDRVEDGLGKGWERPGSIEYFNADGSFTFQENCGIRLQGGHSRRPEKSPKHSFRLVFRNEYGPTRLRYPLFGPDATSSFNSVILRAGFGNSWIHHTHDERQRAQYIRDIWTKDTQRAMGHPSSRSEYVHLYINGIYWGVYAPSERLDSDFAADYLKGDKEDFDVIKDYQDVIDGEIDAWNRLMAMANDGLENNDAYQLIQGHQADGTPDPSIEAMVDVVNLADYMLINFYGGNTDWDHHNWAAVRNRVKPGTGFKFLCWDAEHMVKSVSQNVLSMNNNECPSRVFQQLRQNEQFRRLFADRVQKHCFSGGLLTPESTGARWTSRMEQVEPAIPVESARWGDYRRDVHPYQTAGPFDLYSYGDHWLVQRDFMMNTYFPQRTGAFLSQLRSAGLYPALDAPVFLINGHPLPRDPVSRGDILTMTSTEGVVYFTTNGEDPALWITGDQGNETVLVPENAVKHVLVPETGIGDLWYSEPDYNVDSWWVCDGTPGGVGYEVNSGYEDLITLDLEDAMYQTAQNPNNTCYIRIPFTVEAGDLQEMKSLYMRIRYDDGFAAYLNGTRVAEANASATLLWNSASADTHEAASASVFNISDHRDLLREGENLLAIQALNAKTTSSDFLFMVELGAGDQITSGISPDAVMYSEGIGLDRSGHFMARTYLNGEWSAMVNEFFTFPEDLHDIRITEIHYHPFPQDTIDQDKFEFIELKNTGPSTLDLGGVQFIDGIDFTFLPETGLLPGGFAVVASDQLRFYDRYGFLPVGEYGGNLDNGGEWILLAGPGGDTLSAIRYGDTAPWPVLADGMGHSLVPVVFDPAGDQNDAGLWRESCLIGGSPGRDDTEETAVEEPVKKESGYLLGQNYPNPFSDLTYIGYTLPGEALVEISVYNLVGQKITTLVNGKYPAGSHVVNWNGRDDSGNRMKEGIYFYRMILRTHDESMMFTRKMMLF
ncbi:MAG TPA: T9SS type A sorting domain-containing protein [Bacteroides sp.]|nr:T9SS type A sorting domain-containing protein [Bacteroides sp.]